MTPDPIHPTPEELFAYRDGELPADKRTLLEAHVTTCRACRELIDRVSGLEAALRQSPDPVEGDYYAALSGSVLRKIGARSTPEEEPAETGAAAEPPRPTRPTPPVRLEAPPRERRRGDEPEEPRPSRAPGLPWAPLISTVAAAAAVVVVVVMLFRQGPVERVAPYSRPMASAPRAGAPAESSAAGQAGGLLAGRDESDSRRPAAPRSVPPPTGGAPGLAPPAAPGARTEPLALGPGAEAVPGVAADRVVGREAGPAKAPSPPEQPGDARRKDHFRGGGTVLEAPAMEKAPAAAASSASPYLSVIRRFGLPDVWTGGSVPRDALLKAEPNLRYLYVTGGAGADSARVRLYLAEAARLRYESRPDSSLYETIVHHYWRAIRLAGSQPDVARIARQRLGSFSR